jgi:hypothetical protein
VPARREFLRDLYVDGRVLREWGVAGSVCKAWHGEVGGGERGGEREGRVLEGVVVGFDHPFLVAFDDVDRDLCIVQSSSERALEVSNEESSISQPSVERA